MKWEFEQEFRLDHPETIGETDRHFDLDNYKDWLELQLSEARKKVSELERISDKCHIQNVTKRFELDFSGHLKTLVEINNNEPNILAAMNGYGDSVDTNMCIVTKK